MKYLIAYTLTMTPCYHMVDKTGTNVKIYQKDDSTKVEIWYKKDSLLRYREYNFKQK